MIYNIRLLLLFYNVNGSLTLEYCILLDLHKLLNLSNLSHNNYL